MLFPISQGKQEELLNKGCFPVLGDINFGKMESLASWISNNYNKKDHLILLISSEGGDPNAVMWLSSYLRTLPSRVKLFGVAVGECGSAAFAMLQLCDWRAGVRGTGFFVHRVGYRTRISTHEVNDLSRIAEELQRSQLLEDELVAMQCRRIGCSETDWYVIAMQGETSKSRAILVDEAKKFNFIDRILVKMPL